MNDQERLVKIESLLKQIFALEETYEMGEPIRADLYKARIQIGLVEHKLKVNLGIRN